MSRQSILSLRPIALRPVAAASAILALNMLAAGAALAGEDDVPLSLSLSHNIRRDTNFAKDDNNKYSETINATGVGLQLNKSYGRQTYRGGLNLTREQYAHNSQLNNDGKDANANFSTGIARNWLFNLGGTYSQSLNPVQNNVGTNRIDKNIRTYKTGTTSLQYGNGGTWAIVGSYEGDRLDYSAEAQSPQEYKQRRVGLKAIYFSTDILSYSLSSNHTTTDYAKNTSYRQIIDKDIDVSVDYQATGLSLLNATVGRRSTSYDPSDLAGAKSWTGSAYWNYTPHGIMTYNVSFLRSTGTDRLNTGGLAIVNGNIDWLESRVNNNTVTTSLSLAARASLTGKLSTQLSYSVLHYKIDQTQSLNSLTGVNNMAPESTTYGSYGHTTTLSVDYAALRSLYLGCSLQRFTQGHDLYRLSYSGNAVSCSARFTLNP